MKCINMKIAEILFFVASLNIIKALNIGQDKTNRTTIAISKETSTSELDQNCLHLVKMIRENEFINYTMNCGFSDQKNHTTDVLQHACFVVHKMLNVACEKKLNETVLDLLGRDNVNDICPFDFAHLKYLDFAFDGHEIVKQLMNPEICRRVCYKLYITQTQCILLSKFNNYLKTQVVVPHPKVDGLVVIPHSTDFSDQKTDETMATHTNQKQDSINKSEPKETTSEAKAETPVSQLSEPVKTSLKASEENNKSKKPVTSGAPQEESKVTKEKQLKPIEEVEPPKDEDNMKPPEMENDEQNLRNDDRPLEDEISNEDIQPLNDNRDVNDNPDKDLQKTESFEEKEALSSIKEKHNYIGEGFSQAEDSHFFFYFIMVSSVIVVGYLAFHNKNKILAYALEGSSNRRSRRRPNPTRYRKLETNLEEVISSNTTNATTSSVVY